MTFNYKKYSLEKLEEWVHDSLSCEDVTPQEIYDLIKGVVSENYYTYKCHTERCYELLALLNGNGNNLLKKSKQYSEEELNAMCDKAASDQSKSYEEMIDKGWEMTADGFWWRETNKEDKVVKWKLPVEVDGLSGECYVNLPDDLMEAANINENDLVEWIDRKDGSFELRKVNGTK